MELQQKQLFTKIKQVLAKTYSVNVGELAEGFNVAPTIEQKIETKIQESSTFLSRINTEGVVQIAGEKVGMDITGPVAKRTAAGIPRVPVDSTHLDHSQYYCEETEYDVMVLWKKLDSWAKDPKFYARFRSLNIQQQAHDILMTGWNGQFVSTASDLTAYPMLEDMNVGWLQWMIENAPERVLGLKPDGTVDPINVGKGGDFRNNDQLVIGMTSLIAKPFRKRADLLAITGEELISHEDMRLYGEYDKPSEKEHIDLYVSGRKFGRKRIAESAQFPGRGLMLTALKNLSRYYQIGSRRREIKNDHDMKAIVDKNFVRDDYVIENIEACCMVHPDAIQLKDEEGNWVPAADTWKIA